MRRLKRNAKLENQSFELEQLYYSVESSLQDIEYNLDLFKDTLQSFDTSLKETIQGYANQIYDAANDIDNDIYKAKNIGIFNENQLTIGKDKIEEIERDIKDLEDNLEQLKSQNEQYTSDIEELQAQIEEAEILLEELKAQEEMESIASKLGKVVEARSFMYICHVHDEISSLAYSIIQQSQILDGVIGEAISQSLDVSYEEHIAYCMGQFEGPEGNILDSIQQIRTHMNTGLQMNSKMGAGIERKIEAIEELVEKLEEINEELADWESSTKDLSVEYESLLLKLEELQSLF